MTISTRAAAALVALVLPALTGCQAFGSSRPETTGTDEVTTAADPYQTHSKIDEAESAFTRDGTFETHTASTGIDLVMTVYPTKATPRTHEWYPGGNKYFTFTFQAYDLDVAMRDPFKNKRKVYLSHVEVTSSSNSASGLATTPYTLDADPLDVTLDPDPLKSAKYGQLITSPKGSLEVRNQVIGELPDDTTEVTLDFKFKVWIEKAAGSGQYVQDTIEEKMPIFIYKSDLPTRVLPIAIDAN
ncbi:hypothetical protein [Nocardioides sp. Kera G14]|uniref:hypothetical protein n=1 Tax=Nocardioides sp. Kera G14 TaxID=2884264 RepID=UPI001D114DE2|nr:hypothetical protein [Nocardioides sp. Kera G14]UDY25163.1 hypothetical protein LH076_07705 [Nocardioides sp. Kera G14]